MERPRIYIERMRYSLGYVWKAEADATSVMTIHSRPRVTLKVRGPKEGKAISTLGPGSPPGKWRHLRCRDTRIGRKGKRKERVLDDKDTVARDTECAQEEKDHSIQP